MPRSPWKSLTSLAWCDCTEIEDGCWLLRFPVKSLAWLPRLETDHEVPTETRVPHRDLHWDIWWRQHWDRRWVSRLPGIKGILVSLILHQTCSSSRWHKEHQHLSGISASTQDCNKEQSKQQLNCLIVELGRKVDWTKLKEGLKLSPVFIQNILTRNN